MQYELTLMLFFIQLNTNTLISEIQDFCYHGKFIARDKVK